MCVMGSVLIVRDPLQGDRQVSDTHRGFAEPEGEMGKCGLKVVWARRVCMVPSVSLRELLLLSAIVVPSLSRV